MRKVYYEQLGKQVSLVFMAFSLVFSSFEVAAAASPTNSGSESNVTVQQKNIAGIVKDAATKQPIIGATVMVAGTTKGAVTDAEGSFVIPGVKETDQLEISFMGYSTQKVTVGTQSKILISLKEDALNLDEVVVVGYGVNKKANLTGSVATLNPKAIESRPLQSVSQALQGQVAGVVAVQSSGRPGSQTAGITIRGKNSINAGGPLVIIDGIPGNMDTMDPNDVESMSILKDAASAAIYGVQAASGVILITTKKGSRSKAATVTYNGNISMATPTAVPDYLGSYDYAILYNESQYNQNHKIQQSSYRFQPADLQKYKDGSSPYTHADTDWYAETFRKWTLETQHYISISGGTEKTVYSGSVGMNLQNGKVSNNDYKRFNTRFNIETQATKWLKLGMNLAGYTSINKTGWESPEGLAQYANRLAPIYPIYNEDGTYNGSGYQNPIAERDLSGWRKGKQTEWTETLYAQVNILPELSVKAVYANRQYNGNDTGFHRQYKYGGQGNKEREAYNNNSTTTRETMQALINYDKMFGKHSLNILAGYEQYQLKYRYVNASRKKGGSNELEESMDTLDPANQYNASSGHDITRQSLFGRIQYNYDSRYLFEANVRADASSRFAPSERWGYFPSFSAAWRISQEKFMKNVTWISNLKLRAGYGITGNEELQGNYEWQTTYGYNKYLMDDAPYQTVNESRYANQALTWANVKNAEGAIEAAFLNNTLGFELAVYNKITDGMLLKLPKPAIIGATPPQENAGKVQNTGLDLTVFHNGRAGDFAYNVSLNMGYVKNKFTDLKGTDGENPNDGKFWYIEGKPIGSYYGYRAVGLFRDADDVKNSPKRTAADQPGDIKYFDKDGNGKITPDDREVIGYNFPKWT
ncbi:MAG: TonB-dependent receptor, partial [Rikenellaceae bacterium]